MHREISRLALLAVVVLAVPLIHAAEQDSPSAKSTLRVAVAQMPVTKDIAANQEAIGRAIDWPFHETNLRMRARTGKLWIVTADNCLPVDIPCSAPSGVVDPNGMWAVQAPDQGEQMVVFTIELD